MVSESMNRVDKIWFLSKENLDGPTVILFVRVNGVGTTSVE